MIAFTMFPLFLFGTLMYRYITKPPEPTPPFECKYINLGVNNDMCFHVVYECRQNDPGRVQEFLKVLTEVTSINKERAMSFDFYDMGHDMFICSKLNCENESIIESLMTDNRFNFHMVENTYGTKEQMVDDLKSILEEENDGEEDPIGNENDFVTIEHTDKKNI